MDTHKYQEFSTQWFVVDKNTLDIVLLIAVVPMDVPIEIGFVLLAYQANVVKSIVDLPFLLSTLLGFIALKVIALKGKIGLKEALRLLGKPTA